MNYVNSLQSFMDYSVARREAISNNISNVDTPNYKAKNVNLLVGDFGKKLALYQTSSEHLTGGIEGISHSITENANTAVRTDGNNVDLNKEMVEMVKNNFSFNIAIEALNKNSSMKSIARGK